MRTEEEVRAKLDLFKERMARSKRSVPAALLVQIYTLEWVLGNSFDDEEETDARP